MRKRDGQDRDTSVGRAGEDTSAAGPTAGHAGGQNTDEEIALGGAPPSDDEDAGGGYGSGMETGASALGSPGNAATRPNTFNVPGERDARDARVPAEERDEYRGRSTGGERL
jgi:hypothetical protein